MMLTDELVASLAGGLKPVGRNAVMSRLAIALLAGGAVTFALAIGWLGFRPDLATAVHHFSIWMKWAYTASLAVIAVLATRHLSRPDATRSDWLMLLVIPVGLLAAIAATELAQTPEGDWLSMWHGESWRECSTRIIVLSAPIFGAMLWAFQRLAPGRLRLAGAAAGLASGATAATLYGFCCPETSAAFVITWYSLGMAAATAFGALLGPRLLRW